MTLSLLNAMDQGAFVEALGWIFEASPWVAERAWINRPFGDADALHAAMTNVVDRATLADQLALLRAHPDLGTRARMSDASTGEQAAAGLDRLTRETFDRVQQGTKAYRDKFGFPFLLAVRGRSAEDVLAALSDRLPRDRDDEREEALRQVARIARFRLDDVLGA